MSVAPDGRFVIAWTDWPYDADAKISVRRFAADGTAQGSSIEASYVELPDYPLQYDVNVALSADGRFAVTYNEFNGERPKQQVARMFHADGATAGLPVYYGRGADDYYNDYPTISPLSGGEFTVSWALSIYERDDQWDVMVNWVGGSMCTATPATSCRVTPAGMSKLQANDTTKMGADKIKWSWKKGAETLLSALGNPAGGRSRYEFCLYDGSAAQQPLVDGLVAPFEGSPYPPEWKGGTKGYQASARYGAFNGYVSKVKAKTGETGSASVKVQTQGFEASSMLPFTGPVVAQLLVHGASGVECWQTTFSTLETNDETKVKAEGP